MDIAEELTFFGTLTGQHLPQGNSVLGTLAWHSWDENPNSPASGDPSVTEGTMVAVHFSHLIKFILHFCLESMSIGKQEHSDLSHGVRHFHFQVSHEAEAFHSNYTRHFDGCLDQPNNSP